MEFGTTIPLFFLTLCCAIVIPILGGGALVALRIGHHDDQLSKYMFFTIVIVALLWFLYPIVGVIITSIWVCVSCPESTFVLSGEVIKSSVGFGIRYLWPGTVCGFVIAFAIVMPATILVRELRRRYKKNSASQDELEQEQ